MEKIWTTKYLPPKIEEVSQLSFSALKIISYLENSYNHNFPKGLIGNNQYYIPEVISESVFEKVPIKTFWKTPFIFDHNPTNDGNNPNSKEEFSFKITPNNNFLSCNEDVPYPLQRANISSSLVDKLNESVDMFSDSTTQITKNYVEFDSNSTEVNLSKKIIENTNCLDNIISKDLIKEKKKITHYFPIRKKKFPKLTIQEEMYDSGISGFSVNSMPQKNNSPIKQKKSKSNYSKSSVRTKENNLYNHFPVKADNSPHRSDSKKVKRAKNNSPPCVIDFSNFPSGTFKTIKEFPKPTSFLPFNDSFKDYQIENKSNINISMSDEVNCPSNSLRNDQNQCTNKANKEQPMPSHIIFLDKINNERTDKILNQTMIEIGFTLCYSGGFCSLNKPKKAQNTNPSGILLNIKYGDNKEEFIFFPSDGFKEENLKKFLLNLLSRSSQKICYEAKSFILYVLDNIDIDDKTVCYDWCLLDPSVAFWLLDPDHPAASFDGLLQHISFLKFQKEPNYWSECCNYLKYQNLAMEYLQCELQKLQLRDVFFHLETNIIPILAVMETSGIMVNTEILKKMSTILQEKLSLLEKEAEKIAGHKFSFKSPLQISKVLFEELKLDVGNNVTIKNMTRRGKKSTSESMLKLLGNIHPLPNLILEYRQLWKLKSSYVDTILLHAAKKQSVMAKWDLCATATGRIIATCPNLQAVQKKPIFLELIGKKIEFNLRSCFIAREGCIFVAADFKHIELRMFAHLAKDKILTNWLKREDDVFNLISQARLKKEEITSEDRNQTKTLIYALIYGAGSTKLANILSVEESIVEEIKNELFGIFPSIWSFRENILNEVRKTKVLKTLSGRRRMFPDISSTDKTQRTSSERKAINFIIQGSAADICKLTMIATERKLRNKKIDAKLMLQIHDELLWEVKNDNYRNMISLLEEVIEENKKHFLKQFQIEIPFPIVITSGNNWGNMTQT